MWLVLMSVIAACAWAQLKIEIQPVLGRSSDRLKETERRLRTARQSSWRDAITEEERVVAEAVEKIYGEHFQPQINSKPRIATLTENGKDILVAWWTVSDNQSAFSELIVWDTPENTSFIFQFPLQRLVERVRNPIDIREIIVDSKIGRADASGEWCHPESRT